MDQSKLKKESLPQPHPQPLPEKISLSQSTTTIQTPPPRLNGEASVAHVTTETQKLSMADSRQASTSGTASIDTLSPDERISKAAAEDPEYAAALRRQRERELEQEKLYCSLENKEACLMCSG